MDSINNIFNDFDFKKLNYVELLNEHVLNNDIFLFIALITFLILLALGFQIELLFNDGLDLSQTLGILIMPIIAYFYVELTIPEGADNYLKSTL